MSRRCLLLLVCALALTGCHHRAPKATALPPAPPDIAPVMVSVPPPTHPTEPLPSASAPVAAAPIPVVTPLKRPHKKKYVPAPPPQQVAAANPAPPPPISLGQLSAGNDSGSSLRSETDALLIAQKQRLDKLPATLAAAHLADVEQARRFLKGAEDAWKAGDVEGAHTLGVKAKVLVDDFSK